MLASSILANGSQINTVAMKEKILDILEKHYHGRNHIESRCADELLGLFDVVAMLPTEAINRVEVIDENGRSYVNWKPTNRIELQVQDDGRTLKVFVLQGN